MANRHLSRSIVLQTLFEWDFLPEDKKSGISDAEAEIKKMLERNLKEFAPGLEDNNFVVSLIDQVLTKREQIDEVIKASAPDWPIDKISVVDRNILRIGLAELLFGDRSQVPPKVAINEAIELAKTFGGENSGKFINGVLGAVYKEIGEPGKEHAGKRKNYTGPKEDMDISKLPVEKKGGALVYAKVGEDTYFALVHDVFGYWTISKGGIKEGESEEAATIREVKKEIGLDIKIKEKLGENEFVANHPEKGRTLKRVAYFLAEAEHKGLVLEKSGGLDGAKWFKITEIPELRIYNDIIPLIGKAVEILSGRKL